MNVLFDECVTRFLKPDITGHTISTIDEAGLKGLKNGELLRAAAQKFDVLLTVDKSLPYQQNIKNSGVAVLIIGARDNSYESLKPLVTKILEALKTIKSGEIVRVS